MITVYDAKEYKEKEAKVEEKKAEVKKEVKKEVKNGKTNKGE